jgi:hypothetical protein
MTVRSNDCLGERHVVGGNGRTVADRPWTRIQIRPKTSWFFPLEAWTTHGPSLPSVSAPVGDWVKKRTITRPIVYCRLLTNRRKVTVMISKSPFDPGSAFLVSCRASLVPQKQTDIGSLHRTTQSGLKTAPPSSSFQLFLLAFDMVLTRLIRITVSGFFVRAPPRACSGVCPLQTSTLRSPSPAPVLVQGRKLSILNSQFLILNSSISTFLAALEIISSLFSTSARPPLPHPANHRSGGYRAPSSQAPIQPSSFAVYFCRLGQALDVSDVLEPSNFPSSR